jgi:hypothetical protein
VTVLADGTLYITDYSNHRVRKLDTVAIIHTVAGSGVSGFAGDGGPAAGVRITATTAATGFVPGIVPLQVIQSQFYYSGLVTSLAKGATDPFNVYINVPSYGTQRAAANTPVTLTSTSTAVLSDPVDITINNNATYASSSVTAVDLGAASITAASPGSGINAVGSGTINVY